MNESRIPGRQARAIVYLFLVAFLIAGANILYTAHYVNSNQAAQQRQAARERAAQRKQGAVVEAKLCADLGTMASIVPPAGSASANPSRAYEQAEHRAWVGLVIAIGCKETQ